MTKFLRKVPIAFAVLGLSMICWADPAAISFTGVSTNYTVGTWSLGFEFSPNTALEVTALGFYNADLTGGAVGLSNCTGCGEVGLYDSSGALLASGLVTSAGAQVGDFNYVNVPTTVLTAGHHVLKYADVAWFTLPSLENGPPPSVKFRFEVCPEKKPAPPKKKK